MDDTTCLGLVPFVVIPHISRYPVDAFVACQKGFTGLTLVPLRDDEALVLVEAGVTLVSSP